MGWAVRRVSPTMPVTNRKDVRGAGAAVSPAAGRTSQTPRNQPDDDARTEQGLKHFVLDTNLLLHTPTALFVFKEHHVVIPFAVIEELDKLKRQNDDIGRNARECIRHLDRLRSRGRLIEGGRRGEGSPPGRTA